MAALGSKLSVDTTVERQKLYVQILTTPTVDTPGTTLLLHLSNKRYLFGRVAEGTQRACIQVGAALKRARNVFLTGETKWEHNGGVLGMILTMADFRIELDDSEQSLSEVHIHGGPKIWHSIACARRFIFRTGMPLSVHESSVNDWNPQSSKPDFHDEHILLWAIPARGQTERNSDSTTNTQRSTSPATIDREQKLRQKTVHDMFDSDWRKDKLHEVTFKDVALPAMVWVRSRETKTLESTFCTKREDAPHITSDQKVLVRMPWPAALVTELPPADNIPDQTAMSYVVKGRPQRGNFLPQKAKELGVKSGPLFGRLAVGESITLDDGTVVKPEQVMSPPEPGQGFAVLDVPSEHYLPDLARKLRDMEDANILQHVRSFIWILNSEVVKSTMFADLQAHFSAVRHVVSSPDLCPNQLSMVASAASAVRLNQIRPETFMVPEHSNKPILAPFDGLIPAQPSLIIPVQPKAEIDFSEVPQLLDVNLTAVNLSQNTRRLIPDESLDRRQEAGRFDDIAITTLGTGSAVPSKYRNVSGNLLQIPGLGNFILDAGENTIGQLRRIFSPEELDDLLCNLHLIWISHLHADHHLGTMSLVNAHRDAVRRAEAQGRSIPHKLYVVSEKNMADYLQEYSSVEHNDAIRLCIHNSSITDVRGRSMKLSDTTLPVTDFQTTRVSHCHGAQAVAITFRNGFKISYSGDCRPSASFAQIGKNSDVLIHEATFDDGMDGDAIAKKHSTIGEALGVAAAMEARNVILTHFSQRYQKLPELKHVKASNTIKYEEGDDNEPAGFADDANAEAVASTTNGVSDVVFDNNGRSTPKPSQSLDMRKNSNATLFSRVAREMSVSIAFDLMRVTIPQIRDMHLYYPALEDMFEYEQKKSDTARKARHDENERLIEDRLKRQEKNRKMGEPKKKKDHSKHIPRTPQTSRGHTRPTNSAQPASDKSPVSDDTKPSTDNGFQPFVSDNTQPADDGLRETIEAALQLGKDPRSPNGQQYSNNHRKNEVRNSQTDHTKQRASGAKKRVSMDIQLEHEREEASSKNAKRHKS